jgi:geranylgeranyl diphosphate synthase, type II
MTTREGFDLDRYLASRREEVDALLAKRIPQPPRTDDPGRLIEAIRYSLLAPGKRLRPVLAMATVEAVGGQLTDSVRIAAATVELVHCYSLIHDDLPAMDDDDLRRGQPTSHKVFGEATAILAGDALLTLAFDWLAEAALFDGRERALGYLQATSALAKGAGMWGMVRGQARDLGEAPPRSVPEMEVLHREKTGALFRAAVEVGAAVAGASAEQRSCLARFGDAFGVAFQHADDRADAEHADFTEEARDRVQTLTSQAIASLETFDHRAEPLRALAIRLGGLA